MKIKEEYICVVPSKEQFDIYDNYLGESGERALYYLPKIGKHRIYRSAYPKDNDELNKTLRLLKYKTLEEAQEICNVINNAYNDDFKPILVEKVER